MSSPDPAKIEKYPEGPRAEWTSEATVSAWRGSPGQYGQQFTEIAAPFRSLVAKPTGETHTRAEAEIFAAPLNLYDGSAITMPFEIVVGAGIRA
jgi:hypothetical protein